MQVGREEGFPVGRHRSNQVSRVVLALWIVWLLASGDPGPESNQAPRLRGKKMGLEGFELADQRTEDQDARVKELQAIMADLPPASEDTPQNASGLFVGTWATTPLPPTSTHQATVSAAAVEAFSAIELNPKFTPAAAHAPWTNSSGKATFQLFLRKTKVQGLSLVFGKAEIAQGSYSAFSQVRSLVNGYYNEKSGRLSLFVANGFPSKHIALQLDQSLKRGAAPSQLGQTAAPQAEKNPRDAEAELRDAARFKLAQGSTPSSTQALNPSSESVSEQRLDGASAKGSCNSANRERCDLPRVWDVELRHPGESYPLLWSPSLAAIEHATCFFRFDFVASKGVSPTRRGRDVVPTLPAAWLLASDSSIRVLRIAGSGKSANCDNLTMSFELAALQSDPVVVERKMSRLMWFGYLHITLDHVLVSVAAHLYLNFGNTATVSCGTLTMIAAIDFVIALFYVSHGLFDLQGGLSADQGYLLLIGCLRFWFVHKVEVANLERVFLSQSPSGDSNVVALRVYGIVGLGLLVALLFPLFLKPFLLVVYSLWVPQIALNAKRNMADPYGSFIVSSISVSRLFYPLYLYGCPDNFQSHFMVSGLPFDSSFSWSLLLWVCLQCGFLAVQRKLGSRTLIPKILLPRQYDYNRKIPDSLRGSDCSICLYPVTGVDIEHMLNPCGHLFHRDCLLQWIRQKHQCPTCRAELPPL